MSLSCGTFMLVRCVDWWSVSWHCLVCVCVSKVVNIAAFFIYFFSYFFAGSLIVVGMRGLLSHRMAPSCLDIDLSTAFDR